VVSASPSAAMIAEPIAPRPPVTSALKG
jgi:hypothetical protein